MPAPRTEPAAVNSVLRAGSLQSVRLITCAVCVVFAVCVSLVRSNHRHYHSASNAPPNRRSRSRNGPLRTFAGSFPVEC